MVYSELSAFNEELKNKIKALENQLVLVESLIEYQKAKDIGPTEHFRMIQSKNQQINELKDEMAAVCSKTKDYNLSLEECG